MILCSVHVLHRAWKENLIKKVKCRKKRLPMSDDLGDIMYSDDDEHMQRLWKEFKEKYADEPKFLQYFEEEWLSKPGIKSFISIYYAFN